MAKKQLILKCKCDGCCSETELKAKIESNFGLDPKIAFNHRHTAAIKTGFDITEIPEGYKLCISLIPRLSIRGMVLTNAPGNFIAGEVEAHLLNAGREIVEIHNGDPIVNYWLEPVTCFKLECE